MKKRVTILSLASLVMLMLFAGCAGKTVFQSNFGASMVGQPPSQTQTVGTANVFGDQGSVVVASIPDVTGTWVEIGRTPTQHGQPPSQLAIFQGNFVQSAGAGTYYFSTFLYIPSDSNNVATLQFDQFGWPVADVTGGFLHIDFLLDNRVRIDDNANTIFGTFPRNQVFIVQVTLNVNPVASTAHIVLSGAGASGEADYTIIPALQQKALQFGAVKVWMGFPWTGKFDASQIVVTYNAP